MYIYRDIICHATGTPPHTQTSRPFFIPMASQPAEIEVETWIEIVRQKVSALRFGSVQIIVHEGRVTQVESTEKTRLAADLPAPRPQR